VAPRYLPLSGVLIGALGGAVYWIGVQLWPASIAVILSMLATHLLAPHKDGGAAAGSAAAGSAPTSSAEILGMVFALLIKYNALMALSAASLPFPLPANLAVGLIMIAGHAASRALLVTIAASPPQASPLRHLSPASHADTGIALAVGFAPAALIGIPGLIGLVAAIAARVVVIAYLRRQRPSISTHGLTQQLTEICFYLGALAAWAYI
jgi:adenosylcobinamide-GDP ribazoletransferase